MKIALATHGGQAAGINLRQPPRVVDVDALPASEAAQVTRLVAAAEATDVQESRERGEGVADAMHYKITIEDIGRSTVLAQSDVSMSREFAALLSWVEDHDD